ncbi:uncharacterized protein BO95DRAFT_214609 [Aspergillus brunneoviolaceus CBS 621.78]|uniref:Uncharacterized protein n=1 Tax=Aspergillus brunneoviolaceus CBS 621.78 TaxID=1450534 RepID=A0ACD1G1S0_9EURO|nr:hypothetical protein BO95DRAFT_214609 [Aspergillus brunneoviolaceus CBS 621.78]RAH43179.1 hypothetical protein BO95DRAFT_214609 [Aspergillus brunneoviolaceus CBS 621.78]
MFTCSAATRCLLHRTHGTHCTHSIASHLEFPTIFIFHDHQASTLYCTENTMSSYTCTEDGNECRDAADLIEHIHGRHTQRIRRASSEPSWDYGSDSHGHIWCCLNAIGGSKTTVVLTPIVRCWITCAIAMKS